jgi:uncharacterized membrane protein
MTYEQFRTIAILLLVLGLQNVVIVIILSFILRAVR